DSTVLRHELLGLPIHLGIALPIYIGDSPMRGCPPPIEHSTFRKERDARACGGYISAAGVPLLQPGHESRIFCNMVQHVPTGRSDEDDVGVLDIVDGAVRREAKG